MHGNFPYIMISGKLAHINAILHSLYNSGIHVIGIRRLVVVPLKISLIARA